MSVLVTGGAGYIGSHTVHVLRAKGREIVVLDDLSSGHEDAVPEGVTFVRGDIADRALTARVMHDHAVDAVIHFAARIEVAESVIDPRRYWNGNVVATAALLDSVIQLGIRHFVFSSTAAVYGTPTSVPIHENASTIPINPYGETKLAIERMLHGYARAYGLRHAALRYFNAAGACPNAGLGERHSPESHLIPIVLEAALGKRSHVTVYGRDYDTPDGTCIRDYVHVVDLADAHVAALCALERGHGGGSFNLGTGKGRSVAEVIDACRSVTGRAIRVVEGDRRCGDPASLVASPTRAEDELRWTASRSSLGKIVEDAWSFFSGTPKEFEIDGP